MSSVPLAIAVAITFAPQAFDAHGNWTNSSDLIFRAIGAYLAPRTRRRPRRRNRARKKS
jgi:hypothetical protein